ncbi:MAG: hypothetical protein ACTICY_06665, partial [Pseudolactococcus laudensis]
KFDFVQEVLDSLLFLKEKHEVEILRISLSADSKQCFELYRLSYSSRIKFDFVQEVLDSLLFLKEKRET